MTDTFKVLSLLLTYPTQEIKQHASELRHALAEDAILAKPQLAGLEKLIGELETRDLYDLQECYVLLFDRTRSLSLHLFEHVHGEGRDRGQAMLDLKAHYENGGYDITASELPDYLPLFLEFLSMLPREEARDLLNQPLHVIAALRKRLQKRGSLYASVFHALEAVASGKPQSNRLKELLGMMDDDDPDDFEQLDKNWEDAAVTFGPGAARPNRDPNLIAARLSAVKRPASRSASRGAAAPRHTVINTRTS